VSSSEANFNHHSVPASANHIHSLQLRSKKSQSLGETSKTIELVSESRGQASHQSSLPYSLIHSQPCCSPQEPYLNPSSTLPSYNHVCRQKSSGTRTRRRRPRETQINPSEPQNLSWQPIGSIHYRSPIYHEPQTYVELTFDPASAQGESLFRQRYH
jgi:hypothetical protein